MKNHVNKNKITEGNITKKLENEAIKDRIIRDIRTPFESKEDYQKAARVNMTFSTTCLKFESRSDENKTLSITKYL